MYRYIHNLQGDIVAIVDAAGEIVVKYKYNAWGKQFYQSGSMADSLGALNPFRYRAYVYDTETGLYYLRSRYYNPKIERFINRDSIIDVQKSPLRSNVFSYVNNSPLLFKDSTGHIMEDILKAIESGKYKSNGIYIKNNNLYTHGKTYQLYSPPKHNGPTLSAKFETCLRGISSTTVFSKSRMLRSLATFCGEYVEDHAWTSAAISSFILLNCLNDGLGRVEMDVRIQTAPGNAPRAYVTVQFHLNSTIEDPISGMLIEDIVSSKVLTLVSLTEERGTFWDGTAYLTIDNDNEWLSSLVEGIELN